MRIFLPLLSHRLSKAHLLRIVPVVLCIWFACSKPSDRPRLQFSYSPRAPGSLIYDFAITWQRLSSQNNLYDKLYLKITPGPPPSTNQLWHVRTFSSSDNDYGSGNATVAYTFPSSGTYAALLELQSSNGEVKAVSEIKYIQVVGNPSTQRQFKFRVLSMGANNPFLAYGSDGGFGKAQTAFAQAETQLDQTDQAVTGIQAQDFNSRTVLFTWTVTKAGGNESLPGFGLKQDIAIVCAIENVGTDVINDPDAPGFFFGRGTQDGQPVPARTYTLMKRIRDHGYDAEKTAVYTTATTIHELGHARGLTHAPSEHWGTGLSYCIMWGHNLPPSREFVEQRAYMYEPYFCEGHRNSLKNVTW